MGASRAVRHWRTERRFCASAGPTRWAVPTARWSISRRRGLRTTAATCGPGVMSHGRKMTSQCAPPPAGPRRAQGMPPRCCHAIPAPCHSLQGKLQPQGGDLPPPRVAHASGSRCATGHAVCARLPRGLPRGGGVPSAGRAGAAAGRSGRMPRVRHRPGRRGGPKPPRPHACRECSPRPAPRQGPTRTPPAAGGPPRPEADERPRGAQQPRRDGGKTDGGGREGQREEGRGRVGRERQRVGERERERSAPDPLWTVSALGRHVALPPPREIYRPRAPRWAGVRWRT